MSRRIAIYLQVTESNLFLKTSPWIDLLLKLNWVFILQGNTRLGHLGLTRRNFFTVILGLRFAKLHRVWKDMRNLLSLRMQDGCQAQFSSAYINCEYDIDLVIFGLWSKVHIFWEGHKILRNLHLTYDNSTYSQK